MYIIIYICIYTHIDVYIYIYIYEENTTGHNEGSLLFSKDVLGTEIPSCAVLWWEDE
jgi:hypothetical protein